MNPSILLIVAFIALVVSIRIVSEHERIVVFRLGRLFNIVGPGLVILIPFIDKGVRVNLKKNIPGWETLSHEELHERIKAFAIGKSRSGL